MKQIKLSIKAKDYNITLEDEFVEFFEHEFSRVFKNKPVLDTEDLLRAFVQLTYEKYKNDKFENSLISKINSNILSKS